MWKPRRLTALWAFTACYRDSFTFLWINSCPISRQYVTLNISFLLLFNVMSQGNTYCYVLSSWINVSERGCLTAVNIDRFTIMPVKSLRNQQSRRTRGSGRATQFYNSHITYKIWFRFLSASDSVYLCQYKHTVSSFYMSWVMGLSGSKIKDSTQVFSK
jgi:hypothetical protein